MTYIPRGLSFDIIFNVGMQEMRGLITHTCLFGILHDPTVPWLEAPVGKSSRRGSILHGQYHKEGTG